MIEITICDYLSDKLDVPVYMQRPETTPDSYVIMERTGSSRKNHITTVIFAFQSCSTTMYKAAQLNETVKEEVEGLIELDNITAVRLNSDYNFTNTASKQYRYQAVYLITHL